MICTGIDHYVNTLSTIKKKKEKKVWKSILRHKSISQRAGENIDNVRYSDTRTKCTKRNQSYEIVLLDLV